MRKRNCDKLFDNIMWYLIYLLPIIIFLIVIGKRDVSEYSLGMQFGSFMVEFVDELNPIINSFLEIFTSFFPMVSESSPAFMGVLAYGAYFIASFMMHLMVDFLLFIPRLAHKWLAKTTQGD